MTTAWFAGRRESRRYYAAQQDWSWLDTKESLEFAQEAEKWRAEDPDPEVHCADKPSDPTPPEIVLSVRVDGVLAERSSRAASAAHSSLSDLVRLWLTDRLEAERLNLDQSKVANELERLAQVIRSGGEGHQP